MPDPHFDVHEGPSTVPPAPTPPTPTAATPHSSSPLSVAVPPGYEILCPLGEGGMGIVYLATDTELNRPVALKYLRDKFSDDAPASARFLHEARITARLQHPGIPPVHEVGTLADGRPFLAMKLIQGRTLADLLKDEGRGAARWLGVFESICQALGYAHAQGVIHRDLKPSNVMVGAFGEVQVMDWGLAKYLIPPKEAIEESTDPDRTALRTGDSWRTPGTDETRAGSVLGTPSFMPPEQAIGAVDRVDRRSDVFGLGAILCALLTGKPPFAGADAESTRQLAARAKLEDAFGRLDGCGAEPELIALAKRCLSAEPEARFADAGELAAAVAQLRHQSEERARQAELQRARAVVQASEQSKRRRLTLAASGVLAAVLLAGMAGTSIGLVEAVKARNEEEKQRNEAVQARDQARQRYRQALDGYNQLVFGIQNKLGTRPGTLDLRKDLLEHARKGLRELVREAQREGTPDSTLVWAHLRLGEVEQTLGNTQTALAHYRAGHDLARRLAADESKNAQAQHDLSASYNRLGDVTLQLGQTKEALDFYKQSLDIRWRLARDDPKNAHAQRDVSASYNKLGDATLQLGQTRVALDYYKQSLDIAQRLARDDSNNALTQRDLSVSYERLGNVTLQLGQTNEALDYYKHCLDIFQRLARDDAKNAQAQRDLSFSYIKLGDVTLKLGHTKEALDYYKQSLEIIHRTSGRVWPGTIRRTPRPRATSASATELWAM